MRRVSSGHARDHHIHHHQRSARNVAPALPLIFHIDPPHLPAGLLVERNHVIVGRAQENSPMPARDAAILPAISQQRTPRQTETIFPEQLSTRTVESEY